MICISYMTSNCQTLMDLIRVFEFDKFLRLITLLVQYLDMLPLKFQYFRHEAAKVIQI